jgi:hypothetical protein
VTSTHPVLAGQLSPVSTTLASQTNAEPTPAA